jgi:hypothetical protein
VTSHYRIILLMRNLQVSAGVRIGDGDFAPLSTVHCPLSTVHRTAFRAAGFASCGTTLEPGPRIRIAARGEDATMKRPKPTTSVRYHSRLVRCLWGVFDVALVELEAQSTTRLPSVKSVPLCTAAPAFHEVASPRSPHTICYSLILN